MALPPTFLQRTHRLVFLSPHLDDAILSCGTLLSILAAQRKRVHVITLFTRSSSLPETAAARRFVSQSGYKNTQHLFRDRITEDRRALRALGVRQITHLPFIDAAWRTYTTSFKTRLSMSGDARGAPDKRRGFPSLLVRGAMRGRTRTAGDRVLKRVYNFSSQWRQWAGRLFPELLHLYPTSRRIFGDTLHRQDAQLVEHIKAIVQKNISKQTILFAPLGLGGHVDHVIAHRIAAQFGIDHIIYWADHPYIAYTTTTFRQRLLKNCLFSLDCSEKKIQALSRYTSQLPAIQRFYNPRAYPEMYFDSRPVD